MDHVEWLMSKSDLMKRFFTMVKTRNGTFHFHDCGWAYESRGPDTCHCIHFLFHLQSVLTTINSTPLSIKNQ